MQSNRTIIAAALLVAGLGGSAFAQSVKPIQYQAIDLGRVAGDVYYTVKPDGYHVVATFAERGDSAVPVRIETVLARGQTVTLSAPGGLGEAARSMAISRQEDRVIVQKVAVVD